MVNVRDFLIENASYIDSLEYAGEKLTEEEWHKWIEKECKDAAKDNENSEPYTDEEIDCIIGRLDEDGFVLGAK